MNASLFCKKLLVFVSGFHHSGTTLLQHMILRELGYNVTHRYAELYPQKCNAIEVQKHPSNTPAEVRKLQTFSVPVVWIERDGPNTIWSYMKRRNQTTADDLHRVGRKMCSVKCEARKYPFTIVHLHSLCKSKKIPDAVHRFVHDGRRLSNVPDDLPPSINHESRRRYQATHAIFEDDYDLCFREADPSLHQLLEKYENCMCKQ